MCKSVVVKGEYGGQMGVYQCCLRVRFMLVFKAFLHVSRMCKGGSGAGGCVGFESEFAGHMQVNEC